MKILAINGSYRPGGVTDRMLGQLASAAGQLDPRVELEIVCLRDTPIDFCLNCRSCMQAPGSDPGRCIQADAMEELVSRIEAADALVLASPTNMGSATALFKRFMERLAVYGYWPWGTKAPVLRKAGRPRKPAVLVSSCAAPGILGRLVYATRGQLASTAEMVGAKVVGTLFTGLAAGEPQAPIAPRTARKLDQLAARLLA